MKYTEEMILQSSSGYCMPFEESSDEGVKIIKNYGEQKDSDFNHGIDFDVHNYLLSALASGTVCALGTDKDFGLYQTIRYGKYEVTYSNLATVFVNFGQQVKAGQTVAMSSDKLHFEVKFNGDELDPIQFLTMLYGNIKASRQNVSSDELITFDMPIVSPYDADRKEIEQLMLRYLPSYMRDIQSGHYVVPSHTEQSLRNIFSVGAAKQYFYETIPSVSNPLGIGVKAIPMASKVQNLLISDFLNYMALHHQIYLSSCSDEVKKNSMNKQ